MNMDGAKFGVGLIAGLLVGLAVVGAAGRLGVVPGAYAPAATNLVSNRSSSTVTASTVSSASSVFQSASQSTTSGNTNPLPGNETKSTESSSTTSPGAQGLIFDFSAAGLPAASSRLGSIAQQPLSSDAIVLAPVLVALLLGAILYRASHKSPKESVGKPTD
jgi:hypothetical protein